MNIYEEHKKNQKTFKESFQFSHHQYMNKSLSEAKSRNTWKPLTNPFTIKNHIPSSNCTSADLNKETWAEPQKTSQQLHVNNSSGVAQTGDIWEAALGSHLCRANSNNRNNSSPRYCCSVVICLFIIQILIKCPFFSSLYKNCLPGITTQTKGPNVLSGTHILHLKEGRKTLALPLLSRPSHTKMVIPWTTIQERITLRTSNCLLLTQPKQAIFSYKHHYQRELREK